MRRTIVCSLLISAVAIEAVSQNTWQLFDVWDSSPVSSLWHTSWNSAAAQLEWEFKDPAFLCLVFEPKSQTESSDRRWIEAPVMTCLHPTKQRSAAYEEPFMRGDEQHAQAFGYQIIRESLDGYEVSFQPVDPLTGQPLPLRDIVVVFPRSHPTQIKLSENIKVTGFYGNAHLRSPW